MPQEPALTAAEQKLADVWSEHLRAEFSAHSPDETIVTMSTNPLINQVPVMIGGNGREEVYEFYTRYFLPQIPQDAEMELVSRTIGQGRLVYEMIFRFTHTISMDWMLPGIPPTGKRVEIAMVVVVQFDGDKMAHEHLIGTRHQCWYRTPPAGRSAGRRGGRCALGSRSEHTAKCADSSRQEPLTT